MTWRKAGKCWLTVMTSFQFSASGGRHKQHISLWQQEWLWEMCVPNTMIRDPRHRTSDGGNRTSEVDGKTGCPHGLFVAEMHSPAFWGHGKCWFLALLVVKPIFLSRKGISQLLGNCFCDKNSWGWITVIWIAFLQLIIFKRNWDSAKH